MLKVALSPQKQRFFAYLLVFKYMNNVIGEVVSLFGFSDVCVLREGLTLLACMQVNLASVVPQGSVSGFGVKGLGVKAFSHILEKKS